MSKISIVHLSTHLGGGVGRVLLNFFSHVKDDDIYEHCVYCLDYINDEAKRRLESLQVKHEGLMGKEYERLLQVIEKADIVIIHWWNHPLLYEFLVKHTLPPSRVAFWSHTSGAYPPQVFSKKLLNYSDLFVFTTPMSYLAEEVLEFKNKDKLHDIWSSGGLLHVKDVKKKKHCTFNLGYIGSIDFAKMHFDFVEICSQISIPSVKFIVCGDGCDLDTVKEQVKQKGLEDKFEFMGYVKDIKEPLSLFDIFFYPLNPLHYGTCDQVIAEAMASKVVPVVFKNSMESYMVHHLYSGMVAKNKKEFIENIEILYKNTNLRKIMQDNAKNEAQRRFRVENTTKEWYKIYKKLLSLNKSKKIWEGRYNGLHVKPYEIFLESLGKYAQVFIKNDDTKIASFLNSSKIWSSSSNGSIHQYMKFLGIDERLSYLAKYKGKR